jgi:hypothetical protein
MRVVLVIQHLTIYIYRVFLLTSSITAGPTLYSVFIRVWKGYHHCDCLSSPRHRPLNLPDMRRTTQSWQSVGPALIGQAGKKTTLYINN